MSCETPLKKSVARKKVQVKQRKLNCKISNIMIPEESITIRLFKTTETYLVNDYANLLENKLHSFFFVLLVSLFCNDDCGQSNLGFFHSYRLLLLKLNLASQLLKTHNCNLFLIHLIIIKDSIALMIQIALR